MVCIMQLLQKSFWAASRLFVAPPLGRAPLSNHCQGSHGHGKSWKKLLSWKVMEKSWNMKISQKLMESSWMSWKSHGIACSHGYGSFLVCDCHACCETVITISEIMQEWESWKEANQSWKSHGKVMEFCFQIFVGTLHCVNLHPSFLPCDWLPALKHSENWVSTPPSLCIVDGKVHSSEAIKFEVRMPINNDSCAPTSQNNSCSSSQEPVHSTSH